MELDLTELLVVRIALDRLLDEVDGICAQEPCAEHVGAHVLRDRVVEAIDGKDHGAVT